MRTPKYLSPSALSKWEENRQIFYLWYLCDFRNPRPPQKDYMAVGSGLDAFVKSAIHEAIFGSGVTKGSAYEFETIFESQVEAHIRDSTLKLAQDLWYQYVESGAYAALLADVQASPLEPQMEFKVEGTIEGVPLLGKPDLRYITKEGVHVIADWKVNGSTSRIGASPMQGYKICKDYGSRTHNKPFRARRLKTDPADKVYKDYTPLQVKDVEINTYYLEEFVPYWADQLGIYAWLLGEKVGSEDYVVRMEQVACRPVKTRELPRAKFACHMARISKEYQGKILARVQECWETIQSGHIFTDRDREDSDSLCELLDAQAETPKDLHAGFSNCAETFTRYKPKTT